MAYKLQPAEHKAMVEYQHLDAAEAIGCIEFMRQSNGDAQTVILVKGDLVLQATSGVSADIRTRPQRYRLRIASKFSQRSTPFASLLQDA